MSAEAGKYFHVTKKANGSVLSSTFIGALGMTNPRSTGFASVKFGDTPGHTKNEKPGERVVTRALPHVDDELQLTFLQHGTISVFRSSAPDRGKKLTRYENNGRRI